MDPLCAGREHGPCVCIQLERLGSVGRGAIAVPQACTLQAGHPPVRTRAPPPPPSLQPAAPAARGSMRVQCGQCGASHCTTPPLHHGRNVVGACRSTAMPHCCSKLPCPSSSRHSPACSPLPPCPWPGQRPGCASAPSLSAHPCCRLQAGAAAGGGGGWAGVQAVATTGAHLDSACVAAAAGSAPAAQRAGRRGAARHSPAAALPALCCCCLLAINDARREMARRIAAGTERQA